MEKLAALEMELIERLRKKQSEQYSAYNELEGVLGVPSGGSLRNTMRSSSAANVRGSQSRGGPSGTSKAPAPERSVQQVRTVGHASVAPAQPHYSEPAPGEPTDEEIARAFSKYDMEGAGVVPTPSIANLMADLGTPLTDVQLGQAVAQLDPNQTGNVDFGSFLYWYHG